MSTTLTIDSAGRIVVPKPVREHLGLTPGSELELVEEDGKLTLTPARKTSKLVRQDGHWVITEKIPAGFDLLKFTDDMREERIREKGGW